MPSQNLQKKTPKLARFGDLRKTWSCKGCRGGLNVGHMCRGWQIRTADLTIPNRARYHYANPREHYSSIEYILSSKMKPECLMSRRKENSHRLA